MPEISILSHKNIIICDARVYSSLNREDEIFCDILLVMPDFNAKNFNITTKIAIVYGDFGFNSFKNIKYEQIITYGMSSKSSVTISSICSSEMLIAVLREIIDINGNKIELSEHLCKEITENPLETLALCTLFMINGS